MIGVSLNEKMNSFLLIILALTAAGILTVGRYLLVEVEDGSGLEGKNSFIYLLWYLLFNNKDILNRNNILPQGYFNFQIACVQVSVHKWVFVNLRSY